MEMTALTTRQLSGEHSALADASYWQIVGTGLVLGIVHVLTGPDHLSALAAMTTGSSWRAFSLGVRWGCGHSIGLIIMALIFFAAGRSIDLDHVGAYLNYLVGAFMIALGLWTMRQVKKKYKQKQKEIAAATSHSVGTHAVPPVPLPPLERLPSSHSRGSDDHVPGVTVTASGNGAQVQVYERKLSGSPLATTSSYHSIHVEDDAKSLEGKDASSPAVGGDGDHFQLLQDDPVGQEDAHSYHGHHHKVPTCCKNVSFSSPTVQRLTALLVGIIHGIAGPGGILGVLPAVVMANWGKSTAYLASFCVSSIFIMGVFAALYGEITGRLGRNSLLVEFRIGVFSAAFSLVVGVGWIVLQATGYMSKVFE